MCVQHVGELPQESEKVPTLPVVAGLDFSSPDDVTKGYDTSPRLDHLATAMF